MTAPRVALLGVLAELPAPVTVDRVAARARARIGALSTRAVYDIVGALHRAGIHCCIAPGGTPALFETRVGDNHHHLVCSDCGRALDHVMGALPRLREGKEDRPLNCGMQRRRRHHAAAPAACHVRGVGICRGHRLVPARGGAAPGSGAAASTRVPNRRTSPAVTPSGRRNDNGLGIVCDEHSPTAGIGGPTLLHAGPRPSAGARATIVRLNTFPEPTRDPGEDVRV